MTSTLLNLPSLRRLSSEGFNAGVLLLIEQNALSQAIAMRSLKGYEVHPSTEVWALAETLVPQGEQLYQMYNEAMTAVNSRPVEELEGASHALALYAESLERTAVRALAHRPPTLPQIAAVEQAVGQCYAMVLESAQKLQESGIISVRQTGRLASLTERPTGPLSAFYDKACAILSHRQHQASALRPRAAA